MNTREIASLDDWDERELEDLVRRYTRTFQRLPTRSDLIRFRRARGGLRLRLPAQRDRARRARAVTLVRAV